jgi:uncharacterized protein
MLFVRQITGATDSASVGHLKAQITAALEGADVAKQAITGQVASEQARETISDIEHAGDTERAQLVEILHNSFITPFDREDLFRLSRSIDDVLDNLRDFVREVDLMSVKEECHFGDILEAICGALRQLSDAVDEMLKDMSNVATGALAAKKGGNHIRQLYQIAVADLLSGDFSMDILKKRELLRRLDVVGLRLGEAADALADGAMKRSH